MRMLRASLRAIASGVVASVVEPGESVGSARLASFSTPLLRACWNVERSTSNVQL